MSTSPPTNEACPAELPNWCAQRHWAIFWIIIICSVATVGGRILTIKKHNAAGEPAFFSANDRSRWCTIRALGDDGTYEIEKIVRRRSREELKQLDAEHKARGDTNDYYKIRWDTIDQVRHVGADGKFHLYSSKPTLLTTILAGGYTAVKQTTGLTLERDSVAVIRIMLLIFNGGSWLLFLYFLAKTINSIPVRDWSRYYVLACGAFGTFLTTFSVTLNNHLPAAVSVMVALYLLTLIWRKPDSAWLTYATAGLFAAFAAANELPALSFLAVAFAICFFKSTKNTLLAFTPAALIVVAGFFGTNYLAHNTFEPAYAHRDDGKNPTTTVQGNFHADLSAGKLPAEIKAATEKLFPMQAAQVEADSWPSTPIDVKRWVVRDSQGTNQYAIINPSESNDYQIHAWNNWYDYPGSYWSNQNKRKSKVDRGQADRWAYAFHILFGHHGIFSLTPVWIFSFAGMVAMLAGVKFAGQFQMRWLGGMTLLLSVVVIAFYLRRPTVDCNYGGVTSGLRWVFWLIPFWLVTMLPVVDWLAKSNTGKFACYFLLAISILSAAYSAENPWVNPWLYEIWDWTGVVK
jgi:hypothetical protein